MSRRGLGIAVLAAAAGAAWALSRRTSRQTAPEEKQPELPESQVRTAYGILEGVDQGSHYEYRGVPFAEPPVGDLRWRAPQPPKCWEGVRKADCFPPRCPQGFVDEQQKQPVAEGRIDYHREFYSNPEFDRPDSEDCLYLNLWVPKGAAGRKLPVAVWIHGGAFNHGHGSELEFDGEAYAERDVILVTVNYRVGIFGFLAHPWLQGEDEHHSTGNYGILDQLAALRWVHDNIAAFGGDPGNVTVFGQSAGAMSVQTLAESDLSAGLFAKAIMQSGAGYHNGLAPELGLEEAEALGEEFVRRTGAADLSSLRALSTEDLMALVPSYAAETGEKYGGLCWRPVVDGYVLTDRLDALMDQGRILDIPYLLGTTRNDLMDTAESVARQEKSPLYQGTIAFSRKLAELGRRPAYVYWFARLLPGDACGAWHSSELWYMFGTLRRCWRPWEAHDYALSGQMLDRWSAFMKSGDPNVPALREWKPCTSEEDVLEIR